MTRFLRSNAKPSDQSRPGRRLTEAELDQVSGGQGAILIRRLGTQGSSHKPELVITPKGKTISP
jgi:hypothetical protein